VEPFNVPAGAHILLGAPAKPMPKEQADGLAKMVASIEGVVEAHLPQCFIVETMEKPAQILVVLVASQAGLNDVCVSIGDRLNSILPLGTHLDVWPMSGRSSMLNDVRAVGCEIYRSQLKKPWWKLW
jgi:hypothetical protein